MQPPLRRLNGVILDLLGRIEALCGSKLQSLGGALEGVRETETH